MYCELYECLNCVVVNLLEWGYWKGVYIVVMLFNGLVLVLVWFGIMKIGVVIVFVNIVYGGKEFDFIFNQFDVQVLIVGEQYFEVFGMMKN